MWSELNEDGGGELEMNEKLWKKRNKGDKYKKKADWVNEPENAKKGRKMKNKKKEEQKEKQKHCLIFIVLHMDWCILCRRH